MTQRPRGQGPEISPLGKPAIRRKGDFAKYLRHAFTKLPEDTALTIEERVYQVYVSSFGVGQEPGAEAEILDRHPMTKRHREILERAVRDLSVVDRSLFDMHHYLKAVMETAREIYTPYPTQERTQTMDGELIEKWQAQPQLNGELMEMTMRLAHLKRVFVAALARLPPASTGRPRQEFLRLAARLVGIFQECVWPVYLAFQDEVYATKELDFVSYVFQYFEIEEREIGDPQAAGLPSDLERFIRRAKQEYPGYIKNPPT
jgi:hypothetical protein